MKKHAHVYSPKYSAKSVRTHQTRTRSNLRWLIISAICISTFLCLVGVASATSVSRGSATQATKDQVLQRLLHAGNSYIGTKSDYHNQALVVQNAPMRQTGILDMQQGPFLTSTFTVRNFWQGPVGNAWVLAYAGATLNSNGSEALGGIALYTETANAQGGFDLHPLGTFLAPNGTTALTITEANDNLLQLSSESGANLTFDLAAHQFT